MPKRLSKRKTEDPAQAAFRVVQRIIQRTEEELPAPRKNVVPLERRKRKDPAAVALGRKGGLKSAAARMEKISAEERRRIASHAARMMWEKRRRQS